MEELRDDRSGSTTIIVPPSCWSGQVVVPPSMQYGKEPVQFQGSRKDIHKEKELLTFFHLTGILGTEDDHLFLGEVDGHGGGRGHTGGEPVCREGASVVDDIVGVEALQLLSRRADEHVAHEEGVVGASADDADVDAVALVPSCVAVDDIDAVAGVQVVDRALAVDLPDLLEKQWLAEPYADCTARDRYGMVWYGIGV